MTPNLSKIEKCPITEKSNSIKYLDLGNIPLVNNLCKTQKEALLAPSYPLSLNYFVNSKLTALEYAVNSDLLFSEYLFRSSVNIPYIDHCKDMYRQIDNWMLLQDGDIIVDIGGNDGTLLDTFRSLNYSGEKISYLNIDPSVNLGKLSREKNIDTITAFFDEKLVNKFKFKADVITSTNVFQHLKDINSFVKGIKKFLSEDGIWVLEFPYWINSVETNQFDQVYHEHMYYYSITPLNKLFKKHNLKILNIEEKEMHGGSLRLIISHSNQKHVYEISPNLKKYLNKEINYDISYYIPWGKSIKSFIENSETELLKIISINKKKVYGFGAAAKGCVFMNAMGLTYNEVPFVIDDTDLKQNKYIPGTGSRIVSRDILKTNPPDYILILAHNFKDYIIESLKKDGYKGKFIILIPEFKIYE